MAFAWLLSFMDTWKVRDITVEEPIETVWERTLAHFEGWRTASEPPGSIAERFELEVQNPRLTASNHFMNVRARAVDSGVTRVTVRSERRSQALDLLGLNKTAINELES